MHYTLPSRRWKGFDVAMNYAWRGRSMFDLFCRMVRRCFSKETALKGEKELEEAAARVGVAEANNSIAFAGARHAVRGNAVAEFFCKDPGNAKLEEAMVLNRPLQRCMNTTFAASNAVEALTVALTWVSAYETEDSDDVADKQREVEIGRRSANVAEGR